MTLALLCGVFIAAQVAPPLDTLPPTSIGPVLDSLSDGSVNERDRTLLPSPEDLAYAADAWFAQVTLLSTANGGSSMLDPLRISSQGRAQHQMRYRLGSMDLTDVARPGEALFTLPQRAWQTLSFESTWTNSPGFVWDVDALSPRRALVAGNWSADVGGGQWIPPRVLDREPAANAGGRRETLSKRFAYAEGNQIFEQGAVRAIAEIVEQSQHFPTLLGPAGERLTDGARRGTAMLVGSWRLGDKRLETQAGWQGGSHDYLGAQGRLPTALTRQSHYDAAFVSMALNGIRAGEARGEVHANATFRRDSETPRSQSPAVSDLEGEWLYFERPRFAEELNRLRVAAGGSLKFVKNQDQWLALKVDGALAHVDSFSHIPGGRTGVTLDRAAQLGAPSETLSQTTYDAPTHAFENILSLRAEVEARWLWRDIRWVLVAAADHAGLWSQGVYRFGRLSPAVGLAGTYHLGGGRFDVALRHEPWRVEGPVAAFLNRSRPSGSTTAWNDDGDGVPEAGEEGAVLSRTGGAYHRLLPGTTRPSSSWLSAGYTTPTFWRFRFQLRTVGYLTADPWTVRLADESSYSPVSFFDPGGGPHTRGEHTLPGGGQNLTAYARTPGAAGNEIYVLRNDRTPGLYGGVEVQLWTVRTKLFFMNVGGAAYMSHGNAPFGMYDRNDLGVITEATADPNARVNTKGRLDHDRAFHLNWLSGFGPWHGVTIAGILRYRDGRPMTRMVVDTALPQGPEALMAVPRGTVRHTFQWTVDARVAYRFDAFRPFWGRLIVDAFNLLNSKTELLEDPRTGAGFYRNPIETVPGRTVQISLELGWQPNA